MAQKNKTVKMNIPMCVACVLLCLTLISVYLTSGLYAKYTAASVGSDSARVIRFGNLTITESGDFDDGVGIVIPGVNLNKKTVVDFAGSEASTYVFVSVSLSSHWTTADNSSFVVTSGDKTLLQWSVADGWTFLETGENGAYIYYRELAPNTTLSADVIANDGCITVSDQLTKGELGGMTDMFIRLRAAAAQSGGFADPAAAWKSVSAKEGA